LSRICPDMMCMVAIVVDVCLGHLNAIIGKSFRDGEQNTSQHPAKGACLGEHP